MKIEILKENLERAVSVAAKVSNKNLSLPVLGCVVLTANNGQAVLQATNLDISVEATLKAKVIDGGVVAIPAQVFSQTISALTDKKLTLKTSGNTLIVDGERGTTSITLIDPSEFPTLPHVKAGSGVALSTRELVGVMRLVSFSASTSSIKPELASIYLTLMKGELVAAATDSFRLAEARVPVKAKN